MSARLASSLLGLALAALATAAHADTSAVLFPGRLDIPVVSGSTAVDPCQDGLMQADADVACVEIPRGPSADGVFLTYIDALGDRWDEMSELPGELRFDRFVGESDCMERLRILTDYEDHPARDNIRMIFVFYRAPICGPQSEPQ